jgi:uncharacterized protein YjdB
LITAVAPGTATITVTTTDGSKTATCAVTVTPIAVTGVSLSPTTVSIAAGATSQLTPTVAPSNASNKTVTYASSNTAVATVSASGLVTGISAGTATITVTTTDGSKTATCAVTVTSAAYPIPGKIEAENYASMFGVQTEATTDTGAGLNVGWIDAGDYMNYSVSVATAGTYNVDFRIASTVATGVIQLKSGSTVLGSVTLPNTTGWQVWQTVTMSNVALSAGTQTLQVYASTGGYNINWMNFTSVANVAVTGVSLAPTSVSLAVGATSTLTPIISPANATNKAVSYSSSNTAVATVNASGVVTAVTAGSATITVTTADGSKTATCAVTVTSTTPCSVLAATGDFSTSVSSDASNPTLTFVPAKTGMGATTCILYYSTSATGTFPGYAVTANTPFRITAAAGQSIYFYYTYSLPTGGENNTSANKNSFTVGNCSTLKSEEINSLDIVTSKEFVVYPNPSEGEIVNIGLKGFEEGTAKVQILNMAGLVVKELQVAISSSATTVAVNISELSNGAYIILLQSGSDVKQSKLLINK